jgi:hypothetical protein
MTETLAEKTCTPCRGGVPPLARDGELAETEGHHPDISFGWGSGSALAADRARRATWPRRHGACGAAQL